MIEPEWKVAATRITARVRARRQQLGRDETATEMADRLSVRMFQLLEDDLESGDAKAKWHAKEHLVKVFCRMPPTKESPAAQPAELDARLANLFENPTTELAAQLARAGWERKPRAA